jgi:chemotaxis protein CheY-P-specific phosphatase CheC
LATTVLICDDSSFAQKQMARALPKGWDVQVSFAGNGTEAMKIIQQNGVDILFLDLNMPVMDGYQVLQAMHGANYKTKVLVVSGDIQPEALDRVTKMGAVTFIKKPITQEELTAVLDSHGLRGSSGGGGGGGGADIAEIKTDLRDVYREIANVAMGRAADFLARLLGAFVIMPIPNVNTLEVGELRMALDHIDDGGNVSAVCQGFIGSGIAGEALLIFNESSFKDMAELLKFEGKIDESVEMELLMDISNVLIGACLKGIVDQLDITLSQGHPMILGRHVKVGELLRANAMRWKQTFTIEMGYQIENHHITCDLLLLFTEDSMNDMRRHVWHLMN